MKKIALTALLVVVSIFGFSSCKYQNCATLQKTYPHGVGQPGAVDKTKSVKVTNFKKDAAIYAQNTHLDRDKDKIACEKR